MQRRRLFLDMNGLLDALDTTDDVPAWFLDLQTGEVCLWIDPDYSGEDPGFDPKDARYAPVPKLRSDEEHQVMSEFAARVEDDDARAELRRALEGKGAFRRFRNALAADPPLEASWRSVRQTWLLEQALAWLAGQGIDPEYELRPLPPVQPLGRAAAFLGQAQVGLLDLLLLGKPGPGESEGDATRPEAAGLSRTFVAQQTEQARKVFSRVAREICEHNGQEWRKRLIEGKNDYSAGRMHLSIAGTTVRLEVEVPASVRALFSGRPERPA